MCIEICMCDDESFDCCGATLMHELRELDVSSVHPSHQKGVE